MLENDNFEHHYEYDHPSLDMVVTMPKNYPEIAPRFYFETSHPRIAVGTNLYELATNAEKYLTAFKDEPCVMELIEFVRVSPTPYTPKNALSRAMS